MPTFYEQLKGDLLTTTNLCYLVAVVSTPILVRLTFRMLDRRNAHRRAGNGLPPDELLGPEAVLQRQRRRALLESGAVLLVIVLFPLAASLVLALMQPRSAAGAGFTTEQLQFSFALMLAAFAFASSDALKSYISGLFYYVSITVMRGLQIGDRVTLMGHSGHVQRITPSFIQLVTDNDELVTLPTARLWSEAVVSVNAGARASLCVMEFRIAAFASPQQRTAAENAIWESIQSSAYADLEHPVQILLGQEPSAIVMTAKAYVASTYCEDEFKSDVTSAFLRACDEASIPLAFNGWKVSWQHGPDEDVPRAAA